MYKHASDGPCPRRCTEVGKIDREFRSNLARCSTILPTLLGFRTCALSLSPCGRGCRPPDLFRGEPGEGSFGFLQITPHPAPHFVRRHPLPQGERGSEHAAAANWFVAIH